MFLVLMIWCSWRGRLGQRALAVVPCVLSMLVSWNSAALAEQSVGIGVAPVLDVNWFLDDVMLIWCCWHDGCAPRYRNWHAMEGISSCVSRSAFGPAKAVDSQQALTNLCSVHTGFSSICINWRSCTEFWWTQHHQLRRNWTQINKG